MKGKIHQEGWHETSERLRIASATSAAYLNERMHGSGQIRADLAWQHRFDHPVMLRVRPLNTMKPNDVCQLVESLCEGNDNAFHTLIEAGRAIIPLLIEHFSTQSCGADRARIIEVIWQHRDRATIPFLASALRDPYAEVWKNAIDGLVTLGGAEVYNVLIEFRSDLSADSELASWIDEAVGQLRL